MNKATIIATLVTAFLTYSNQAQADLSESYAQRLVDSDCSKIRRQASFKVSSRCDFEVTKVEQLGSSGANVHVFSKGFLYNIKFTAIYQQSGSSYQLVGVKEGYFTGFSDFLQKQI